MIGRLIAGFPHLTAPQVFSDYTSRRVLTLSRIYGRQLTALTPDEILALDAPAIAKDLLGAYLKQIVVDGVFHSDPHPGNILVTQDGKLALLDFGMVGRMDAGQKDLMITLLLAFAGRQGERVADTYLKMIEVPHQFNKRSFTQDVSQLVSRYHDMSGGRMDLGTALLDLTKLSYRHQIGVPSSMTLIGKTMLNLDGTIRRLSPTLDPVQLIRDYMLNVMYHRKLSQFSPSRVSVWLLDALELIENSPRHTGTILDKLANDQFTFNMEVNHIEEAVEDLNRAANRLSAGMVAGSVIIGLGYVLGSLIQNGWKPAMRRPRGR